MRFNIFQCDETLSFRRRNDCEPDAEARATRIIKNDAPDTSGVNKAAKQSANTAADALAWAKQVYAEGADQRASAANLDNQVAQAQLEGMNFATQQAKEQNDRYKSTFQPIEDKLAADAMSYDTPARRAEAAARAGADVETQAGQAMQEMNRDLLRRGGSVDDGSARGNALDLALGKARARSSASDAAVRNVESQGYARMMDAAGLGKGVISNQATQQNIATNTGGAATQAAGAGINAANSGNQVMQTGYGQAMQGYGTSGQLYGQATSLQNQARGQDLAFLSSAMNMFASDKNKKKRTGNVTDGAEEMAEVRAIPVHQGWQYDPEKGGPDDGGIPHTGPMAQQVRATMGEMVAPGGKVIDLVSMNGKLMASMQNLDKRIQRLERAPR